MSADTTIRSEAEQTPQALQMQLRQALFMPPDAKSIFYVKDVLAHAVITSHLSRYIGTQMLQEQILRSTESVAPGLSADELKTLWNKMDRHLILTENEAALASGMRQTYPYLFGSNGGIFNPASQGNEWKRQLEKQAYAKTVGHVERQQDMVARTRRAAEREIDEVLRYSFRQAIAGEESPLRIEETEQRDFEQEFLTRYGEPIVP